jgi:hypothetical protein
MRLNLPNIGFLPQGSADQTREDMRNIRPVEGTGGPFLVCPGLLELQGVQTRGLILEDKIARSVPLDGSFSNMLEFVTDTCQLTYALDGTPLVERNRWSNDGVWQPDIWFVKGVWDTEISPPIEDLRPQERIHRPILTTGEVTGDGEVRVQSGKGKG